MATFLLRTSRALLDRDLRRQVARIAIEVGEDMPDRQPKSKAPADPEALRGVPFIGKAVPGGVAPGTDPEREAIRRLSCEERLSSKLADLDRGAA